MLVSEFLQRLETRTHVERVQTMIELGREARNTEETALLLAEMAQGDWYQRFLALYACFGSLNTAQVLTALDDDSRIIRGLALRLVLLVCSEDELQQTLEQAPQALRLPLLWKLAKHGYQVMIDRFVEQASPTEPQFCQWLCLASGMVLHRRAREFQAQAGLADWIRLARAQPVVALEMLIQWVESHDQETRPSVEYINKLLPLLARTGSARCLDLLRGVTGFIKFSKLAVDPLARRFPVEITEMLLAQKELMSLDWQAFVPELPVSLIRELCVKQKYAANYTRSWFPLLSPEKRLAFYHSDRHLLRDSYQDANDDTLPYVIAGALPQPQRAEEARKALRYGERMGQYFDVSYAALLPWDEARTALASYMHSSDAEQRSQALFAQIEAMRYQKTAIPMVLEQLLLRRTEHDGVRKGMLFALAALPATWWQREHLPYLEEIIRHGLNDVGLSQETHRTIIKLSLRLLPVHFAWSIQQLTTTLRERGFIEPIPRTERDFAVLKVPVLQLTPKLCTALLEELLPIFQTWAEREKEGMLLDVVTYFAPPGSLPEQITRLLVALLEQTGTAETADRLLNLLFRHEPRQFATALVQFLQEDASWITRPLVANYLMRYRQDLLTPFLRFQTYSGRFNTGRTRFHPPLRQNATCLTASQQARFTLMLSERIRDTNRESRAISEAIKSLAFLPAQSPETLFELARHKSSIIRTTALFTLGRLDSGNVVPELLAALQDSRARIAIVVLRPLLLRMPSAEALALLRTVPRTRVTVAKETMRLIGDLASEDAYRELLELEQSELHRDVRIALFKTLWKYPHYAQTWTLMEQVIQNPDKAIAETAIPDPLFAQSWKDGETLLEKRVPETGLTYHQHILRLAALLLRHPQQDIRFQILNRYTRSYRKVTTTDYEHIVLPQLVEMVSTGKKKPASQAAMALFRLCQPGESELVRQVLSARLEQYEILEEIVDELEDIEEETHLPLIYTALEVLATRKTTTLLRISLALNHLPADELYPFFSDLIARGEFHAEALSKACQNIDRDLHRFDLPTLEKLERQFAASSDERLRRPGLALLLEMAQREKWTPTYRALLEQYRADSSLMIATVALFTFPDDQDDDLDDEDDDLDDDLDDED